MSATSTAGRPFLDHSPLTTYHSPLTKEQDRAVRCREASVVLSSGAGCGKTHVLTERYLSHLRDDGAGVGELVAITFTDRAARQMRGRIRQALAEALRTADRDDAARWEAHLRDLETAQITTIHAFCGALLRQHAVDAGLDPKFDILEDVLAANLEGEALTVCLQTLLPEPSPPGDDLRELVFLYGWPMTVEAIRSLMRQHDEARWQAWLAKPPEQLAAEWRAHGREAVLPAYVAHLVTASPKIANCLTLLRKLECVGPVTREDVARILRETPALARAPDLAAAVKGLTEAAKVVKEKAKAWKSEADYEAVKKAFGEFREELPERLALFLEEPEGLPAAVEVGRRFLRVAAAAAEAYRRAKRRNGVVDFQDLLTLARDLLRDNPDVRAQLQRRYRFLLIDELQDTDPVQMELVTYLCGAGLTAGKLFAVGDHKQCLLPGTKVLMGVGRKSVEKIVPGDVVRAAAGQGMCETFEVGHVHRRDYAGDVVEIRTRTGRVLRCTPEHALFSRLVPDLRAYYVYLMRHPEKGFRIGLTRGYRTEPNRRNFVANGLDSRCRQEGGDAIWVLRYCQERKEAQLYEQLYTARYGLPGLCFRAKNYGELDQEAIDYLFAVLPTRERAEVLARELGIDLESPQFVPFVVKGHVTLTFFGTRFASQRCRHRIHFETRDRAVADRLKELGCRKAKPTAFYPHRWRIGVVRADYQSARDLATQVARRIDAPLVERYALTGGKSWKLTPAAQVFPGLQLPVVRNGKVIADEVVSVLRVPYEGPVFDLTIPHVHNYAAGGVVVHNSIYRFRQADVQQFLNLRREVPHEGRLNLSRNFRSQPAVLDFVNALLGPSMQDYRALEPHHPQANAGPCVEFLWTAREGKAPVNEGREQEAAAIARRIARMVGGGEALVRDGAALRPVKYGDIVLLFRAMSNVHLYEAALRKHGIDYYLVGGRAFFAQQEIYDLLNLLRALENPQDAVSLAGTLRSPFCGLSDEALFLLGCHPGGLWAGLHDDDALERLPDDQKPAAERARRFLGRWRALKDRLPIARLLGEVFADSGYDAAVQYEPLGDRKLANLWKLLDLARTFDRPGLFGLADFIARLGDLVASQPREEQAATQPEIADVVRLMTIHQAKGLEFPVVFVPDLAARGGGAHLPAAVWDAGLGCVARPPADEDPPPFTDHGWRLWRAGEEMADYHEDLRTLYVACTRAEDYLVLSASLPEPFRPNNAWMLTLAGRFDLTTGECRDETIPEERRPRVCVTDVLALDAGAVRKPPKDDSSEVKADARRIGPVAATVSAGDVVPLAALEELLQATKASGGRKPPERSAGELTLLSGGLRPPLARLARQFAAEDGSDRRDWLRPRDRIALADRPPRDRLLRDVLERWDFRDPDGWRPLLPPDAGADMEAQLARFAAGDTFRQLSTARHLTRDLEFLLDPAGGELPRVRGVIDCLWQDASGDWHLLAWDTAATNGVTALGKARRPGLVVQAWAVERSLGVWPKSVGLYSFLTGEALNCPRRQFREKQVIAAVREALSGLHPARPRPPA